MWKIWRFHSDGDAQWMGMHLDFGQVVFPCPCLFVCFALPGIFDMAPRYSLRGDHRTALIEEGAGCHRGPATIIPTSTQGKGQACVETPSC